MFKTSRVKNNEKIIKYLSEQIGGIINIKVNLDNNYETYEELVSELKNYYEKFDYKEDKVKYLKRKLIVLESEKLNISNSEGIKEISVQTSIMLAFISVLSNFAKDILKNDINRMFMIFSYIALIIMGIIIIVNIIGKLDLSQNRDNRNKSIAINIHKSIIEEQLNEIEETMKQNEKSEKENHGMIKRILDNFI